MHARKRVRQAALPVGAIALSIGWIAMTQTSRNRRGGVELRYKKRRCARAEPRAGTGGG
jgi:hypothetical protein